MVSDKLRGLPDFPPLLRALVEHMILSHHGQLEFGSPKLPQFPEALMLHYLDDMDSKMECMRSLLERDRQVEGCFTTFHGALGRSVLKKDRYLSGELPPKPKPAPTPPPPPQPAAVVVAAHPLFAPKHDSPFAGKLKQALQGDSQER
jgi:3'-5' exoribonuclease